jgi:hypothetical protein
MSDEIEVETNESNNGHSAADIEAVDRGLDEFMANDDITGETQDPPLTDKPADETLIGDETSDEALTGDETPAADEPSGETPAGDEKPADGEPTAEAAITDENGPIEPPKNINPKNLGNFRRLEAVARKATAEVTALREQVATFESAGAGKLPEPVEQELTELRKFRATYDLKNDPEFIGKYDTAVKSHESTVAEILKKNGAKDEQVQAMLANGLTKYSSKWWDDHVFGKIPSLEADRIKRAITSVIDLDEAKSKELETNATRVQEIQQEREQQQQALYEKDQEVITTRSNELFRQMPWAQRREIPAKATADQRKEVEAHNKNVERIESMFNNALYPTDPRHRAEIAVAAVAATSLAGVVQQQQAELEQLRTENASLKKGRQLPASRSGATKAPPRSGVATIADGFTDTSSEEAIERGLDEAVGA